jgi:hypothetical protein
MLKTLLATLAFAFAVSGVAQAIPNAVTTASGKPLPGYSIASHIRGYCWTSSNISTNPAAWRCMAGNDIYDPCFAPTRTTHVVYCMTGPSSKKLYAMTLTKPLQ